MEKYICKIDGSEFTTQEDLINYIKDEYIDIVTTEENKDGLSIEKIYKAFKKELPDYVDIKVKTDHDNGGFLVNMNSPIHNFTCLIGEGDWDYYYYRFIDLNEAIEHYKNFFSVAQEIVGRIFDQYGLQLEVCGLKESAGEDEAEIIFKFDFNGEEEIVTYEFNGVDEFVHSFKQYTSNVLEGELEIVKRQYYNEYKIGGIPIDAFAKRSKRVRLEILE